MAESPMTTPYFTTGYNKQPLDKPVPGLAPSTIDVPVKHKPVEEKDDLEQLDTVALDDYPDTDESFTPPNDFDRTQSVPTRPTPRPTPPSIVITEAEPLEDESLDSDHYDTDEEMDYYDEDGQDEYGDLSSEPTPSASIRALARAIDGDSDILSNRKPPTPPASNVTSVAEEASAAPATATDVDVDVEKGPTGVIEYSRSKTSWRLPVPIMCFICYAGFLLGGLSVVFSERRSYYVCFHGWQSTVINILCIPGWLFCIMLDIVLATETGVWGVTIIWGIIIALIMGVCFLGSMWRLRAKDKLFMLPIVGRVAKHLTDRTFDE